MQGVVRQDDKAVIDGYEGDEGKVGVSVEDIETPPPPDDFDEKEKITTDKWGNKVTTIIKIPKYNSPPKIQIKELIKARAQSSHKVFANGRAILTADCKYSNAEIIYYDREWKIDGEGHLEEPVSYEDTETSRESQEVECVEGSSSVFINGIPAVGFKHKLSVGKHEEHSNDVLIPG